MKITTSLATVLTYTSLSILAHANSDSILDQLRNDIHEPDKYIQRNLDEESLFAPSSDGDSDLGEQLILKKTESRSRFQFKANTNLYYSNNIGNAANNTEPGWIWASNIETKWVPKIGDNLFLNISVNHEIYHYETNHDLDFANVQTKAGIVKILPESDVLLYAELEHNYARRNFFSDNIHGITSFNVGANKTFFHNAKNTSYLGAHASFDLHSTRNPIERDELTIRAGHNHQFNDKLRLTAYSDLSWYSFNQNRDDFTYAVGLHLEYAITANASAYTSINYFNNNSDVDAQDYSTTLGVLGAGIKASF